jgi:ribonuclease BN (tRNA processing enzyme)
MIDIFPPLELLCLGVGKGASYVMRGITSTAFALLHQGQPLLLVDCGAGVVLSCLRHMGTIPRRIFITHNHHDHTGDLNVLLYDAQQPYHLYGHADVLTLVQQHRMHDAPEAQARGIARHVWHPAAEDGTLDLGDGLSMAIFPVQHGYVCYGFVLALRGVPLLAYSADTGYVPAIYDRLFTAPTVIADGRERGGAYHAGFDEIEAHAARFPSVRCCVVHHEDAQHTFAAPNVSLLREGQRLLLEG